MSNYSLVNLVEYILLNQRNYNDNNDVSVDFASLGSPVRHPKRLQFVIVVFPDHTHLLFLSSVCNVSQAMTNVNSCKEMFHPYISVYYHVYLCNNV